MSFIKSIVAGVAIGIAAAIYLTVGGVLGAFMFSVGLLTILHFGFNLFTGKVGLLVKGEIGAKKLVEIWTGNLVGTVWFALIFAGTAKGISISEAAAAIVDVRISNLWWENIAYGIVCGILMFIAVKSYINIKPWLTILCVASFILLGMNHCIADMAYMLLGASVEKVGPIFLTILETTVGNAIGANLIAATSD